MKNFSTYLFIGLVLFVNQVFALNLSSAQENFNGNVTVKNPLTNTGDELALVKEVKPIFLEPENLETETDLTSDNLKSEKNFVIVDFSKGTLVVKSPKSEILVKTEVVLPRKEFYKLPVIGVVTDTTNKPTWTPTETMHKEKPGKYKKFYRPGEPGNAMGHCKVSMDFSPSGEIKAQQLTGVRIHGNAKTTDLKKRKSAGCIRIPDKMCSDLLKHLSEGSIVKFIGSDSDLNLEFMQSKN